MGRVWWQEQKLSNHIFIHTGNFEREQEVRLGYKYLHPGSTF